MAGRSIGVDPEKPPAAGALSSTPRSPLWSRLNAHASGRRSGDQLCVYVSDRFVVPALAAGQLDQFGQGTLKLDTLTKRHIREHLSYRYITDSRPVHPALQLERQVQPWSARRRPALPQPPVERHRTGAPLSWHHPRHGPLVVGCRNRQRNTLHHLGLTAQRCASIDSGVLIG
jgi:hypothetical protein